MSIIVALFLNGACPGALDDGRGRARLSLFRHKHEVESGRTSSVGMEVTLGTYPVAYRSFHEFIQILGFGPDGAPILPSSGQLSDPEVFRREKMGWEEISVQASKIVSFSGKVINTKWVELLISGHTDLAGHERYLKTTLYGLTSGAPSCVILIVGANAGLIGMSKEHLAITLALGVPVVVCVTKVSRTDTRRTC